MCVCDIIAQNSFFVADGIQQKQHPMLFIHFIRFLLFFFLFLFFCCAFQIANVSIFSLIAIVRQSYFSVHRAFLCEKLLWWCEKWASFTSNFKPYAFLLRVNLCAWTQFLLFFFRWCHFRFLDITLFTFPSFFAFFRSFRLMKSINDTALMHLMCMMSVVLHKMNIINRLPRVFNVISQIWNIHIQLKPKFNSVQVILSSEFCITRKRYCQSLGACYGIPYCHVKQYQIWLQFLLVLGIEKVNRQTRSEYRSECRSFFRWNMCNVHIKYYASIISKLEASIPMKSESNREKWKKKQNGIASNCVENRALSVIKRNDNFATIKEEEKNGKGKTREKEHTKCVVNCKLQFMNEIANGFHS